MVEIRFITADEMGDFVRAVILGFGEDPSGDAESEALAGAVRSPETSIAAFDRGRIVATFASIDFDLTVPGSTRAVPMAGTTSVTVQPTHRRRGILTEMMRTHLQQAVDQGLALAGLWASEEQIYGRFGYGVACTAVDLTIPTDRVTLPPGPSDITVRTVSIDEARQLMPPVYDRVRAATPGFLTRSDAWWQLRHWSDPKHVREGGTARRIVVAERGDEAVGYVSYRQRRSHDGDASVEIRELVAVDDDARRSLWSFAAGIDLFPKLRWGKAPVDDPVVIEADYFRLVTRSLYDSLWLRVLDVHEALEGRRYERDGVVRLGVADRFLSRGGTFDLEVSDGVASCKPSTGAPDVELDISDLGSLYLGGVSATFLARAGRLRGSDRAVRTMDDVFRTVRAPHCIEVF